jgi:hypothetical protein
VWAAGDILSLDSGGNYKGYIGDLCRMAIQGEPDGELEDLLGEVYGVVSPPPIAASPSSCPRLTAPPALARLLWGA